MIPTMRRFVMFALVVTLIVLASVGSRLRADTGTCGDQMLTLPFTDVPSTNIFFCAIAEAFFSGLTNGTSANSYSPTSAVSREQMAAFVTRSMDQSLRRGSNRAALNQYWTTRGVNIYALTTVGMNPRLVQSDGADLWVATNLTATSSGVCRVRASDGKLLESWTGAINPEGVLVASGRVFISGGASPGRLYMIDPRQPAGAVTELITGLGANPKGIAFDGDRIWTANLDGSVSHIILSPPSVTNVSTGFTSLIGVIYDGGNIWVTDDNSTAVGKLHKLDSNGAILLTVDVGGNPRYPAFDGMNIWVPNFGSNTISVVRATGGLSGIVIATLSGNGLNGPRAAAFDGERILVTNAFGHNVSLWKAPDLTPIGTSFLPGAITVPYGVCSDGLNFWITFDLASNNLARF